MAANSPNACPMESHFVRGQHTLRVPMSLFRGNRDRVIESLRKTPGVQENSFVVVQGGDEVPFNDTDVNYEFRQESFFQWCFGVEEPGCYGALDITSGKSILFFPRLGAEYEIWCGKLSTLDEFRQRYDVDEAHYVEEIAQVLKKKNARHVLTLRGLNSDSGLYVKEAEFDGIDQFKVNNELLYPVICECLLLQEGPLIMEAPLLIPLTSDVSKFPSTPPKTPQPPLKNPQMSPIISPVPAKDPQNSEILVKINGINFMDPQNPSPLQKRIEINTEDGTAILFGGDLPIPSITKTNDTNFTKTIDNNNEKIDPINRSIKLEDVPLDIRCRVYLQILQKIIQSENSMIYYDEFSSQLYDQYRLTRNELLQDVVDTICGIGNYENEVKSGESPCSLVLEGLNLLAKDRISPPRNPYRDKLVEEALRRVSRGELSLEKILDIVKTVSRYHDRKYRTSVDLLWAGIDDKQHEITSNNFLDLIRTLDYFGESQGIVKAICETKLQELWRDFSGAQVAEINRIFQDFLASPVVLTCLKKWADSQLGSSTVDDATSFIKSLTSTKCYAKEFETGIESLITQAEVTPPLLATVMTYCLNLRIRNGKIMDFCANYITNKGMDIPENLIAPIFAPFGYLNCDYGTDFWKSFERILSKKLGKMNPHDAIDVLISCAYLQKYSLQFSHRVFRSRFVRRAKSREKLRGKMRFLDKCLGIEFDDYVTKFEEERGEVEVASRPRLRRALEIIWPDLIAVFGEGAVRRAVVVGEFLGRPDYIVDAVIDEAAIKSNVTSEVFKVEGRTALVIHVKEDFCRGGGALIGPRALRVRQLRKMGMRVVTVDYRDILRIHAQGEGMREFLREQFQHAEEPM